MIIHRSDVGPGPGTDIPNLRSLKAHFGEFVAGGFQQACTSVIVGFRGRERNGRSPVPGHPNRILKQLFDSGQDNFANFAGIARLSPRDGQSRGAAVWIGKLIDVGLGGDLLERDLEPRQLLISDPFFVRTSQDVLRRIARAPRGTGIEVEPADFLGAGIVDAPLLLPAVVAGFGADEVKIRESAELALEDRQIESSFPASGRKRGFEDYLILRIGRSIAREAARNVNSFGRIDRFLRGVGEDAQTESGKRREKECWLADHKFILTRVDLFPRKSARQQKYQRRIPVDGDFVGGVRGLLIEVHTGGRQVRQFPHGRILAPRVRAAGEQPGPRAAVLIRAAGRWCGCLNGFAPTWVTHESEKVFRPNR
jgi:hypothetical protein